MICHHLTNLFCHTLIHILPPTQAHINEPTCSSLTVIDERRETLASKQVISNWFALFLTINKYNRVHLELYNHENLIVSAIVTNKHHERTRIAGKHSIELACSNCKSFRWNYATL